MRPTSLLLLLALAAPATAETVLSFDGPALLQFDELYYAMSPGTLTVADGAFTTNAPVSLGNCLRASGLAQTASPVRFRYGVDGLVYLDATSANGAPLPATLGYAFGQPVVSFRSRTGDVVCSGSVVPDGAAIFGSGFE
jgi:hypothetical protein